jgi:hypothetical protein
VKAEEAKNLSQQVAEKLVPAFQDGIVEIHLDSGCLFVVWSTRTVTKRRKALGFQASASRCALSSSISNSEESKG